MPYGNKIVDPICHDGCFAPGLQRLIKEARGQQHSIQLQQQGMELCLWEPGPGRQGRGEIKVQNRVLDRQLVL